jgi:apolipoprotein N-acyltransferase
LKFHAAAGLLGVLAAGALPPVSVAPVLFIALPGLLEIIGAAPNWRGAALRGLTFGIFHHIAGLYWITNAILVMAAEFWWAVPVAVPLLALVLAVFIAVPCGLARLAPPGWRRLFLLAGAWVLGDLARQFVLSGFPWNLLGSATEMPGLAGRVFMQPAALVGAHGLTLAVILVSGGIGLGRRGFAAAVGALLLWAGIGAALLQRTATTSDLTAVIVQGNVSELEHRDHWRDSAWSASVFDKYLALTREGVARAKNARSIVVWPETASPYDLGADEAARRAVAAAAAPALMTLAGTVRFELGLIAHNSLVAVAPDASDAGDYDKAHLVPYGEYFPSYAHFMLGEQGFVPGPGIRTLHLPGLPAIGPLICYEAIFPAEVVRESDRPGLLVNVTNDSWYGESAGPWQHLAAARLRTVEEGLPMLRAANTGISAVIDPFGRVTASLGLNRTGVLVQPVPGHLARTPASYLGLFGPGLLAVLCCLACLSPRQRRPT